MALTAFFRQRVAAIGLIATGVLCPCHVLVGLLALLTGESVLSPAAQDGVHAVYVPGAVMLGAFLLRRAPRSTSPLGDER